MRPENSAQEDTNLQGTEPDEIPQLNIFQPGLILIVEPN